MLPRGPPIHSWAPGGALYSVPPCCCTQKPISFHGQLNLAQPGPWATSEPPEPGCALHSSDSLLLQQPHAPDTSLGNVLPTMCFSPLGDSSCGSPTCSDTLTNCPGLWPRPCCLSLFSQLTCTLNLFYATAILPQPSPGQIKHFPSSVRTPPTPYISSSPLFRPWLGH